MNYRLPTKAIITDAGCASRFLPLTKTIPKAMLPLGNKPIMQLVVEECIAAGIEEIIIVATSKGRPLYDDYFHDPAAAISDLMTWQGKEDRFAAVTEVLNFPKITVIEQDPSLPYGNGSPIASARDFIDDDEAFVVAYSDDVVFGNSDIKTLIDSYAAHPDAEAIIVAQEMPQDTLDKYGIVKLKDGADGQAGAAMLLDHIVEKPAPVDAPSNLASYGRYLLTPRIFDYLKPDQTGLDGELWTVDAITAIAEASPVYVEKTAGRWLTTGDPKNYSIALAQYILEHESYADEVRDYVREH